jgi:very-short-patch-repair endonuclease
VDIGRHALDGTARLAGVPDLSEEDALRGLGRRAALSHEEAARRLGIELVEDTGTRRLTVPRTSCRVRRADWEVVRADIPEEHIVVDDGIRITGVARTVADLARVLPTDRATAAADSALRQGLVSVTVLLALLGAAQGRGARGVRLVASLLDPLSGSVLESLLRVLLVTSRLPAPISQHDIRSEFGRVIARVDLCWVAHRLVVEADGFAFHSKRDDYRRDRQRMNELERQGWRVLRFTWEDVLSRPTYVVSLVRQCLEAGPIAA